MAFGLLATPQALIVPVPPTIGITLGEGTSQGPDKKQATFSSQASTTIPKSTHERVIIHIVDFDSDKDNEPILLMTHKKGETPMQEQSSSKKDLGESILV